jgi:hypothetical protein
MSTKKQSAPATRSKASVTKRATKAQPIRQPVGVVVEERGKSAAQERLPSGFPILYADQVIDVIYGIHTSKIVLGVETGNGLRPVGVASLPTAALLAVADGIVRDLTSPAIVEETRQRLGQYLKLMGGLATQRGDTTQADSDNNDPA